MKRRGLSLVGLIAVLVAVAIGIGVTVWYLGAILTAEQEATGLGQKGGPNPIEQAQQLQQEINRLFIERLGLGGALDLYKTAVARHDDVHIDLGRRILFIIQIEYRFTAYNPDEERTDKEDRSYRLLKPEKRRHHRHGPRERRRVDRG